MSGPNQQGGVSAQRAAEVQMPAGTCSAAWLSYSSLEINLGLVSDHFKESLSEKTWQDYWSSWSSWCVFLQEFAPGSLELHDLTLLFINRLFSRPWSFNHVFKILAGI